MNANKAIPIRIHRKKLLVKIRNFRSHRLELPQYIHRRAARGCEFLEREFAVLVGIGDEPCLRHPLLDALSSLLGLERLAVP